MDPQSAPTESTALLNGQQQSLYLPSISVGLTTVGNLNWAEHLTTDAICPSGLFNVEMRTAYALNVLHQLCSLKSNETSPSHDIWDSANLAKTRNEDIKHLNRNIELIWKTYTSEYRTTAEIEAVLWTEFSVDESRKKTVSVLEFLSKSSSPLVPDTIIGMSLSNTWRFGPSDIHTSSSAPRASFFDTLRSPRVLHAIDLLSCVAYVVLLLHYVLYPPTRPTIQSNDLEYLKVREGLILLWSIAIIFRPRSAFQPAAFLSLLAFLVSLIQRSVPFPGEPSFNALLLGACMAIFYLFAPFFAPNPLLIFAPPRTLPLSVLFANGPLRIISPIITFFWPLFLICFILLSISLQGTFFSAFNFASPKIWGSLSQIPPMETRTAFLLLLFALLFTMTSSFLVLVTTNSSSSQSDVSSWDYYTKATGKQARRAFFGVIMLYSRQLTYPVPLNLIQYVFVTLPTNAWVKMAGHRLALLKSLDRLIWFTLVGPFILLTGCILYWIPVD